MITIQQRGFTLIEIIVALVILSIALNAFYFAFSSSINALRVIQDKTVAEWVALNVIAEAQLGMIDMGQFGYASSNETMAGVQWHWHATLGPTSDPHISCMTVDVRKVKESFARISLKGYLRNDHS